MQVVVLIAFCLLIGFARIGAAQAVSAPTSAAAPSETPVLSSAQIQTLLQGLSSDDFRVRQAAQQQLVALGEDARPIIADLLARTAQTQTRASLEVALAQIDENRASGATIVSLHVKDAHPREVFEQLARQSHAPLPLNPENLWDAPGFAPVTLDIDHQPFWVAFQKIVDQTHTDLQSSADGLRIVRGPWHGGPTVVQGPFMVVASQIARSQTIALGPNGANRADFSLLLLVYAEPKIKVLEHSGQIALEEADDDNGNILLPDPADVRPFYGGGGGIWTLHAQLHYPDHPGKVISQLRGRTWFVIQTASERLVIPDLLKAKETSRTIGGLPISIGEVKKTGELFELHAFIVRQPTDPHWAQIQRFVTEQLHVYDAAGQLMIPRGTSTRSSPEQMEIVLTLSAAGRPNGEPAKLIWDIPTAAKAIDVPFEFSNLPMPR